MRIQIQTRYGVHVSNTFPAETDPLDLKQLIEHVVVGKVTFLSFETDSGDTMYFPEEILKNSIISLVGV